MSGLILEFLYLSTNILMSLVHLIYLNCFYCTNSHGLFKSSIFQNGRTSGRSFSRLPEQVHFFGFNVSVCSMSYVLSMQSSYTLGHHLRPQLQVTSSRSTTFQRRLQNHWTLLGLLLAQISSTGSPRPPSGPVQPSLTKLPSEEKTG